MDCVDAIVTIDRFNQVNGLTSCGLHDRIPDTVQRCCKELSARPKGDTPKGWRPPSIDRALLPPPEACRPGVDDDECLTVECYGLDPFDPLTIEYYGLDLTQQDVQGRL